MSGLELSKVVKRFGDVTVVQQMDLAIDEGEFVVLLGESGCGKSTTLRMIAGLEDVSEGQIAIGGRDVTDVAPMARDIAMVFQSYALYPHMDVRQNMSFALRLAGRPAAEIDSKVQAAAKVLNMEHLLARKPKELSGGQRQRVAIGRAIVREPKVFLFDEPLSNLDAKLRVAMRAEIKALHQRLKTTTVYVTHDQIEAMTMADRIVVMHDGIVEQIGTPLELFDRPGNLFVAQFIGSPAMNVFDGTLRGGAVAAAAGPGQRRPGGALRHPPDRPEPGGIRRAGGGGRGRAHRRRDRTAAAGGSAAADHGAARPHRCAAGPDRFSGGRCGQGACLRPCVRRPPGVMPWRHASW
jgi:ABC-type sugar transport system ATPase subunit